MVDYYGLAVGHDETPVALHLLSAPLTLFWRYELIGTIDDEWFQNQVVAGDKTRKLIGKPRARWTLAACTLAEVEYLQTNIWTAQSVQMTIRMPDYNTAGHPFTDFNCLGHWLNYAEGIRQFYRNGIAQALVFDFDKLKAVS